MSISGITHTKSASRESRYESLFPQIEALIAGENNVIANLANIASALKYGMGFFWVGFYFVQNKELILGPFQGPVACTRIGFGKGVCGTAWKEKKTILVPDVDLFPEHIACSSESKSEIVVPIFKNQEVVLILDIDSEKLNHFDETDQMYLEKMASLISGML